jgi:hypothetical protein
MTNNKQQTAVEWLFSETLGITLQLANKRISHRNWELQMVKLYEQAKEMEKEQKYSKKEVFDIIDKVFHLYASSYRQDAKEWFEKYNKTYGGGEQ